MAKKPLVLVADDEDNDYFLLHRAFQKSKLEVDLVRARDGQEVISYLQGNEPFSDRQQHPLPSLLLLDLKMPRRNGFEVLEWLRKEAAFRRMVVVVLTSSRQHSDINHAYDLGANSYLVKPLGFEELVGTVELLHRYWSNLAERPELPGPPGCRVSVTVPAISGGDGETETCPGR